MKYLVLFITKYFNTGVSQVLHEFPDEESANRAIEVLNENRDQLYKQSLYTYAVKLW